MIDMKNFFDQPVKNDMRTFENLELVKEMIIQVVIY